MRFVFDVPQFRKLLRQPEDMATVDVHGRYVIPYREFSALSVLTVWAMREPRYHGTGNSKIPTLFVL